MHRSLFRQVLECGGWRGTGQTPLWPPLRTITRALCTLVGSVALLFAVESTAAEPVSEHPNILLILVDDMGVMDSSVPFLTDAKGQPEVHPLNRFFRTPNMERLARNGIRFEQFYANSVCSPTRVSLMTGQSSARHHTTQWINPTQNNAGRFGPPDWQWKGITTNHQTLPALLKQAGYRTIHVGKAHFGPNGSFGELPQNFGFDVNIAGRAIGHPGSYYGTENFGQGKEGRGSHAVPGLEAYHGQDIFLTEALTLEMKREIGKAVEARQPFFAYMAHYAVHAPFQSDERYAAHYQDADVSPAAKAFATMIEGMDASVGALLDHLETLGVAQDTLVLFLGDNGTDAPLGKEHEVACAAPLRGKKGTHYEGGMRVPFMAAWARPDPARPFQKRLPIPTNTLTREMGMVADVFPTLLGQAGVRVPGPVDGQDLAPVLKGGLWESERIFLMHFPHDHRSSYFTVLRQGDWKLAYHYRKPAGQRCELFQLAQDRGESTNLADQEPEQRDLMIRAMADALNAANAQYVRAGEAGDAVLVPDRP